jgi:hypothetical protein
MDPHFGAGTDTHVSRRPDGRHLKIEMQSRPADAGFKAINHDHFGGIFTFMFSLY